mgnify:CR=1 FL=1
MKYLFILLLFSNFLYGQTPVMEYKVQMLSLSYIDNVKFNQNVEIFLKNFYEKNIPKISGTIFEISKDVIFDENLRDFYFEIKIKIDDNLKIINHQNLSAGMAVDVFIKQKNRNIFSYIFSPIFNSITRAFKEFN